MLSPHAYPFRKMAWFNLASHRSKIQLAPPTGNIYGFKIAVLTTKSGTWISLITKFQLKQTISIFLDQICPKKIFPV